MDHDFCREHYHQLKQQTDQAIVWRDVEVRRGDLGYTVRQSNGNLWYGPACCEWDARIRAVPKLYRLPD